MTAGRMRKTVEQGDIPLDQVMRHLEDHWPRKHSYACINAHSQKFRPMGAAYIPPQTAKQQTAKQPDRLRNEHQPQPDSVDPVVRVVAVPGRRPTVVGVVVPRAAGSHGSHNTVSRKPCSGASIFRAAHLALALTFPYMSTPLIRDFERLLILAPILPLHMN